MLDRAEVIRDATPDEAQAPEDLQRRSSLVWEEYRDQLLAHPDAISLPVSVIRDATVRVACGPERILGFSVMVPSVDGDGPDELDGLFVEPDAMRGGVGRALIADVVARSKRRGVAAIEVTANPRALDFYRKVGFRDRETVATRFGPGLRMRLRARRRGPLPVSAGLPDWPATAMVSWRPRSSSVRLHPGRRSSSSSICRSSR